MSMAFLSEGLSPFATEMNTKPFSHAPAPSPAPAPTTGGGGGFGGLGGLGGALIPDPGLLKSLFGGYAEDPKPAYPTGPQPQQSEQEVQDIMNGKGPPRPHLDDEPEPTVSDLF